MIKVPFDIEGYHGSSMHGQILNSAELDKTLDSAYRTMEWFKYLADHATEIKVLENYANAATVMTRYVVGIELEGKHETFYRLKYHDGR